MITNKPNRKDKNLPAHIEGVTIAKTPDNIPLYIHNVIIWTSLSIGVPICIEDTGLPVLRSSREIFIIHDSSPTLSIGGNIVRKGMFKRIYRSRIRSRYVHSFIPAVNPAAILRIGNYSRKTLI